MIWSKGSVSYYVDDPTNPYVTYTPASLTPLNDSAIWPFDSGQANFIILNLAIGGPSTFLGTPDPNAPFADQEMLVDYVRVYQPAQ